MHYGAADGTDGRVSHVHVCDLAGEKAEVLQYADQRCLHVIPFTSAQSARRELLAVSVGQSVLSQCCRELIAYLLYLILPTITERKREGGCFEHRGDQTAEGRQ